MIRRESNRRADVYAIISCTTTRDGAAVLLGESKSGIMISKKERKRAIIRVSSICFAQRTNPDW